MFGEHRRIEARFHQVHVQERAVEQVVVQFLAEGSLTRQRVQRLQQQRLRQTLGCHRGPPTFEYIQVKSLDMRSSTSAAARLMVLSGWSGGTRSSRLTKAAWWTGDCADLSWDVLLGNRHGEGIRSRQLGKRSFKRRFFSGQLSLD